MGVVAVFLGVMGEKGCCLLVGGLPLPEKKRLLDLKLTPGQFSAAAQGNAFR